MIPQEAMIARVRELCRQDERLVAALMYGSFSQGEGDLFSDIEFWLWFDDACLAEVEPQRWVARVAPVAAWFVNEFGTRVAIFDNLVRGEFHFDSWRGPTGSPGAGAGS